MIWREHYELKDRHAMLSPSSPAWINYDLVKMATALSKWNAAERGTKLHALAKECIDLGVNVVSESDDRLQKTMGLYVNDCIQYKMKTEQTLYYSPILFGTADAIRFENQTNTLYIFDLKTGTTTASFRQLEIYACLFCLEYGFNPLDLSYELRIYQNSEIRYEFPTPEHIDNILQKILNASEMVYKLRGGGDEFGNIPPVV